MQKFRLVICIPSPKGGLGTTKHSKGSIITSLRLETHGVLKVVLDRTSTRDSGQNTDLTVVYRIRE